MALPSRWRTRRRSRILRPSGHRTDGGPALSPFKSPSKLQLSLLLVAAVASGALVRQLGSSSSGTPSSPAPPPGYYLIDAELTGTGDDGRVLYRLHTRRAERQLDTNALQLDQVQVQYAPGDRVPWTLRADTGRMDAEGDMLQLRGNVVAVARQDGGRPATIRTEYLEIDPDSLVAETPQVVNIEYADGRVTATGMRAYLREDRLQLLSNVHGTFAP
ncbi:MAG TPA: LPS export ABC transporter periplasmic protein LptC [Chromatiales bacterium]|nr:LPS export ABC transporter periplasmic protein LptC [Chromatiales bacterium]